MEMPSVPSRLDLRARLGILGAVLLSLTLVSCGGQAPQATRNTQTKSPADTTVSTQAAEPTTGTPVLVQSIAGIRVGEATDSDVVSMYGSGLVIGHGGYVAGPARYYTDPANTVTLHVGTHTDDIVVTVELSDGVALPPGIKVGDDSALVAPSLSVPVPIDQGITLGMTASEVLGRLGRPEIDETEGILRTVAYNGMWDGVESNYYANYLFVRDRLRSVSINVSD